MSFKGGAAIIQAVLDTSSSSDSSNGDHQKGRQPKKRQKRELSYETAIASPLYRKYLKIADEDPDPTSSTSIYNDSSRLGLIFRRRFRIPYSMFNHLVTRYKVEEDCRKDYDATGKNKKHDIRLLALGVFRVLARDLLFDELEDLIGISEAANRHFFYEFTPWIADNLQSTSFCQEQQMNLLMWQIYTELLVCLAVLVQQTVSMYSGTLALRLYKTAGARGRRSTLLWSLKL